MTVLLEPSLNMPFSLSLLGLGYMHGQTMPNTQQAGLPPGLLLPLHSIHTTTLPETSLGMAPGLPLHIVRDCHEESVM